MSEIIDAAKNGDLDTVRQILDRDPSAAAYRSDAGETPLMAALYRGHADIVQALEAAGAPIDIHAAAATGNVEELEREINKPAAVTSYAYDGWTPLHLAAFFGHRAAAERLLTAGADVNAVSRNSLKNTALHAATSGRHEAIALLLIDGGADVHLADAGGHTALHIAAENGLAEVVRRLVAAGADAHAVDAEDKTPLSRAAAKNHGHIVDLINDPR